MSNNILTPSREAVRVQVKKCTPNAPFEWRKFSIDPRITTLEILYSLVAKAFELKTDFSIKYKTFDPAGNKIYLSISSDWDLNAAFHRVHNLSIQTSTEPCLTLEVNLKPYTEFKGWDSTDACSFTSNTISTGMINLTARDIMSPFQQSLGASQKYVQQMHNKLPGIIMNQMEKTFSMVQKAFNLSEETMASLPPRPPLSDSEFRLFLDALGQIQRTDELRKVIFLGGIDPSLRRVVWKHILNVYPDGMNGHQRMSYMRRKSEHYYILRDSWMKAVKEGCTMSELVYVTSMVRKDVLRTDRLHAFYAGSDDNQNVVSLFNILTTYALNHPSVSYCQGMSDIASPLLVTMNDEAHAYICFCAIMKRVRGNFMLDGIAMTRKFAHLMEAVSFYDPEFWEYLKLQQADDLLFCYRWLLLELKREFPFEDSLRMLEVQWSSLKYNCCFGQELMLYEKEFKNISPVVDTTTGDMIVNNLRRKDIAYTKVCPIRRQNSTTQTITPTVETITLSSSSSSSSLPSSSSSLSLTSLNHNNLNGSRLEVTPNKNSKFYLRPRLNQSLDDNISACTMKRCHQRNIRKLYKSLDEMKIQEQVNEFNYNGRKFNLTSIKSEGKSNKINKNDAEGMVESNSYEFHDTNPFKNDALANDQAAWPPKEIIINQPMPKAFICSSSSSDNSIISDTIDMTHCPNDNSTIPMVPVCTSKHIAYNIPQSIAKLQNKNILSNYNAVTNIIAKQFASSDSTNEGVKYVERYTSGKHFKHLKEKIAATRRKSLANLDKEYLNGPVSAVSTPTGTPKPTKVKLVRNLNEFFSFTSVDKSLSDDDIKESKNDIITNYDNPPDNNNDNNDNDDKNNIKIDSSILNRREDLHQSSIDDCKLISDKMNTTIGQSEEQSYNNICTNVNVKCKSFTSRKDIEQRISSLQCTTSLPKWLNNVNNIPLTKDNNDNTNAIFECLDNHLLQNNYNYYDYKEERYPNTLYKYSDVNNIGYKELHYDRDSIDETAYEVKQQYQNELCEYNKAEESNSYRDGSFDDQIYQESSIHHANAITSDSSSLLINDEDLNDALISNKRNEYNATDNLDDYDVLIQEEEPTIQAPQLQQEEQHNNDNSTVRRLPSPTEFGDGNPFLIFLCLTLLLQHRNTIMRANMDYNEIAMYFDKMVRRHDVTRVLNQARRMYLEYLKIQTVYKNQQENQRELRQQQQQQQQEGDGEGDGDGLKQQERE